MSAPACSRIRFKLLPDGAFVLWHKLATSTKRDYAFDVGRKCGKLNVCAVRSGLIQARIFDRFCSRFALGFLGHWRGSKDALNGILEADTLNA